MATRTPGLQARNQEHRDWGNYGSLALLPNGSGAALADPEFSKMEVGDTAYVIGGGRAYCTSVGTVGGADAVWALGGGGGGLPDVEYTTSPTSADYYSGAVGVCDGGDDFIVSIWYRVRGPDTPSGFKDIVRNDTFNSGWALLWSFGTVQFEVFDGSAVQVTGSGTQWYAWNRYEIGRDVLITLRVYQSGGVMNVELWFNDTRIDTQAAANSGMTVSTGTLKLAGGGEGEMCEGLVYYEGTMTDAEISDWVNAAMAAGSTIAMPSETNRWSYADNVPGATWAPSTGVASLTRNGTPGTATYKVNRA